MILVLMLIYSYYLYVQYWFCQIESIPIIRIIFAIIQQISFLLISLIFLVKLWKANINSSDKISICFIAIISTIVTRACIIEIMSSQFLYFIIIVFKFSLSIVSRQLI